MLDWHKLREDFGEYGTVETSLQICNNWAVAVIVVNCQAACTPCLTSLAYRYNEPTHPSEHRATICQVNNQARTLKFCNGGKGGQKIAPSGKTRVIFVSRTRSHGGVLRHSLSCAPFRAWSPTAKHNFGHADSDCCAKWSMLLCEGEPVAKGADWPATHVDANGCYTVMSSDVAEENKNKPRDVGGEALAASMGRFAGTDVGGKTAADPWAAKAWNRAQFYRVQVVGAMEKLPKDHPGRKPTVTLVPPKPDEKPETDDNVEEEAGPEEQPAIEDGMIPDEKLMSRGDFYQNDRTVTVTVFAKDIEAQTIEVVMLDHAVSSDMNGKQWATAIGC